MIAPRPGLDVSALVREVLAEGRVKGPSRLAHRLGGLLGTRSRGASHFGTTEDPYTRLFGSTIGRQAANAVGNESKTLDALSSLTVEILLEYLKKQWGTKGPSAFGARFLVVSGDPTDPPTLLALDPALAIDQSRRLTNEIDLDPQGLIEAFESLRSEASYWTDDRLAGLLQQADPNAAIELLWISQPEVVLSRRPRMVPLSAPAAYLPLRCGVELSTVGVFCRDEGGALGVTGCYHGTGPVGTAVQVDGVSSSVTYADVVQDIVFIPLPNHTIPSLVGKAGLRDSRAPSQAETVTFEGAGSGSRVQTRIQSHDAGILRKRPTVQLRVQTPADTNTGDSGAALIDDQDRVVAFAFERTGIGEFPELTDWIWAANALAAIDVTPV